MRVEITKDEQEKLENFESDPSLFFGEKDIFVIIAKALINIEDDLSTIANDGIYNYPR